MDIIKNKAVVPDEWTILRPAPDEAAERVVVPAGKVIVPLKVWQAQHAGLGSRAELGVWLASDERPEAVQGELEKFAVIAVDFPRFTDGRGYTIAYLLRTRFGYRGELRAIGDVLRDQLFYMQRVGFDAFVPRADKDIHDALKGLGDFSEVYQASADRELPLFRRVQREAWLA
ncbi:MAG: DUF934 domain-containing protein [Sideroxydans sp.]|nr:DUF934 domain-containing protein [Sideroxydans sp.]